MVSEPIFIVIMSMFMIFVIAIYYFFCTYKNVAIKDRFLRYAQTANIDASAFTYARKSDGTFINYYADYDEAQGFTLTVKNETQPVMSNGKLYSEDLEHGTLTFTNVGFFVQGVFNEFSCNDKILFKDSSGNCKIRPICEHPNTYSGINIYQYEEYINKPNVAHKFNRTIPLDYNDELYHKKLYAKCDELATPTILLCNDNEMYDESVTMSRPCKMFDICQNYPNNYIHNKQIDPSVVLFNNQFYMCLNKQSQLKTCESNCVFSANTKSCIAPNECTLKPDGYQIKVDNHNYVVCNGGVPEKMFCAYGIIEYKDECICISPKCNQEWVYKNFTGPFAIFQYPIEVYTCPEYKPILNRVSHYRLQLVNYDKLPKSSVLLNRFTHFYVVPVIMTDKYIEYSNSTYTATKISTIEIGDSEFEAKYIKNKTFDVSYDFGLPVVKNQWIYWIKPDDIKTPFDRISFADGCVYFNYLGTIYKSDKTTVYDQSEYYPIGASKSIFKLDPDAFFYNYDEDLTKYKFMFSKRVDKSFNAQRRTKYTGMCYRVFNNETFYRLIVYGPTDTLYIIDVSTDLFDELKVRIDTNHNPVYNYLPTPNVNHSLYNYDYTLYTNINAYRHIHDEVFSNGFDCRIPHWLSILNVKVKSDLLNAYVVSVIRTIKPNESVFDVSQNMNDLALYPTSDFITSFTLTDNIIIDCCF